MRQALNMCKFLLASLCLHVALLLPLTPAFQFGGDRETVLTVTISRPLQLNSPTVVRPPPATRRSIAPAPQAALARADDAAEATATTAPDSPSEPPAESEENSFPAESARARIEAQLQIDLQRYFGEYPRIARHRGWEGTVWLSYTIRADGTIDQVEVDRSSGYRILDDHAVATMRHIERLADAGRWLGGRSLSMNTPVLYRLEDR